jgi:hypothetical protein
VFRDPDQEFQYTKYIVLGSTVDPENVKATSATANGDDLNGSDDENGVVIPALTQGTTVTLGVTVTAHELSTGYLNAWFDWNGDGDFLDVGERVTPTAIAATQTGVYNITLNVPLNAITTAPTFARFRVGPANNAFADASYRENTYGEAEDYMITIVPKSLSIGDYVWDDLDGDGIQDSVELGLSGVIVELYDCNSNGSPLSRATTDATGLFLFENVLTGSYYIKFILPGTNKFRCNGQK